LDLLGRREYYPIVVFLAVEGSEYLPWFCSWYDMHLPSIIFLPEEERIGRALHNLLIILLLPGLAITVGSEREGYPTH
jgi:hypothetical protein